MIANSHAKANREPDSWKPSLQTAWCGYGLDWIAVKTRWELAHSTAEVDALKEMLGVCDPSSVVIDNAQVELANPIIAPVVEPTATTDVIVTAAPRLYQLWSGRHAQECRE